MKKIVTTLVAAGLLSSCASSFFHKEPEHINNVPALHKRPVYFISMFTRKKIDWYGEMDRNWVTFHRLDPLFALFTKELQLFLKVTGTDADYVYEAKTAGIKDFENKKYLLQEKGILLSRQVDFYNLAKQLKAPEDCLFLSLEITFDIYQRNHDNSETLSECCLMLKDFTGKTVFKKHYYRRQILSREEYMTIISYQKRNKEAIAKMTHQLFVEGFMHLSRTMLQDLQMMSRGNP